MPPPRTLPHYSYRENLAPLDYSPPAIKAQLPKITDSEFAKYLELYETSKHKYQAKVNSLTDMGLRNKAEGDAGRAEAYHECIAWIQLELNYLYNSWEDEARDLFDQANEGKMS